MTNQFQLTPSIFKTGGPEVIYQTEIFECCVTWEVVTGALTWKEGIDGWKRESFWVRNCGYCGEIPTPREQR